MTKLTKLMILLPLVALGAACNGASPTAPDNLAAPEMGSAFDSTQAVEKSVDSCKGITAVDLSLAPSTTRETVIQASYVSLGGSTSRCPAPIWSSKPRGAVIAGSNPFKVRIDPAFKSVTVFARASNGVQGSIHIGLQSEAAACKNISSVSLKLVATPQHATVLQATYVTLGGVDTRCAAPVWSSNPSGALVSNSNPFRTGVDSSFKSVTVYATAPNGVQGRIHLGLQSQAAAACKNIRGVELKLVATPQQTILIQATYVGFGGVDTRCSAPVWTSNPRGALVSNSNPYRSGVDPSFKSVTVFATAPNGVRGRINVSR